MQIKRDYSQPFFSTRRRRRSGPRFIFMYGLFLGGFLIFVSSQFSRLQLAALDAVGMAPTPTAFASTWAQQGYDLYSKGKIEAAANAFQQAVSQQPDNVNYLYEYGRMLLELDRDADEAAGRPQKDADIALEVADQAINAAPQDVRGYALKAKALVWTGDSASAIPIALQGREIDPEFAPIYSALAWGYTNIGRYQQGLDNGEQAVQLDPLDADAHRSYAVSLIFVGLRDEAIRELEDAVNINPNLVGPYFELAGQYGVGTTQEDAMSAVATYEKILTIDPRNAKAMLRMCELYFKVGEAKQAEGYCDDALQVNPNYKEAYRQLGMVNYSRRNYEGAILNFNKCVDLKSEEIQCFYLRGLAHFYLADGKNEHCDLAWTDLKDSLNRAGGIAGNENIVADIQRGLELTTQVCPQYSGLGVPTVPPPTSPPPTPLGGLGG